MSIMSLLDEYIDLKIEGEPASSDWRSISEDARIRDAYRQRLADLRAAIDAALTTATPEQKEKGE